MNKQLLLSLSLVALVSVSSNVFAASEAPKEGDKKVENAGKKEDTTPKVDKKAEQEKLAKDLKDKQDAAKTTAKALKEAKEVKLNENATDSEKEANAKLIAAAQAKDDAANKAVAEAQAKYDETTWTGWVKKGGAKAVAVPVAFGQFFIGYEEPWIDYANKTTLAKAWFNRVSRVLAAYLVYEKAFASSDEDEDNN